MECPVLSPAPLLDVESKASLIKAGDHSSSGSERQKAEKPLQSSWIQRLKLRDRVKQGGSLECSDSGLLQNKDCIPFKASIANDSGFVKGSVVLENGRGNEEEKCKNDTVVGSAAHGSLLKFESSTVACSEIVEASTVVQSTSGFGPWITISSRRKPVNKSRAEFDGIYCSSKTGNSAILNTKKIIENSTSRVSQVFQNSTIVGKPPLPPFKNKPQKFATSKNGVFCSGIGMAISDASLDVNEIYQDSEGVSCFSEKEMDREASQAISFVHEEHVSQISCSRNAPPFETMMSSCSHSLMRSSSCSQVPFLGATPAGTKSFAENSKDRGNILGCLDLSLSRSVRTTELVQKCAASTESRRKPQKPLMEGSQVTANSAGGGAISSTSAGLGVDLFVETSGASQKECEQFMEVYKQARDELKSQKTSHIFSRTHSGQTFSVSGNTVGKLSQTSKQREQLEDQQFHGKHELLNTDLQHRSESSKRHGKGGFDEEAHNNVTSSKGKGEYGISHNGASIGFEKDSDIEDNIRSTALGQYQSGKNQEQGWIKDKQGMTSILGKRQYRSCEDNTGSKSVPNGGDVSPSKCNFWIQRWYTNAKQNTEGLPNHSPVFSDAVNRCMKKFRSNGAIEGINASHENKSLADPNTQTQSVKVLPSAAAMAIVGTAARQFCTTQPQRKRSFGFWAGFDSFISQKLDPAQIKGKAKLLPKDDP